MPRKKAIEKILQPDNWKSYRKKPIVVRAIQLHWSHDIPTLEGVMRADPGDWLIQGAFGEFYPCKPDIFAATYDLVEEPDAG